MVGVRCAHTEPSMVGFTPAAPAPRWLSLSPAPSLLHRAQDSVQSLPVSLDLQRHWRGCTSGWAGPEYQPTAEISATCPGPTRVPSQTANIYFRL